MEQSKKFEQYYADMNTAYADLQKAMHYAPKDDDSSMQADLIRNGLIQKFEFNIELLWKTVRYFLIHEHGQDFISPKQSIKAFFRLGFVEEKDYILLFEMLEWRNRLSHVYRKELFEEAYPLLPSFVSAIGSMLAIMSQSLPE